MAFTVPSDLMSVANGQLRSVVEKEDNKTTYDVVTIGEEMDKFEAIEEVKKEADELMMNKISKYEKEITELKKELQEVKEDNKKLALQINEMIARLRDANF